MSYCCVAIVNVAMVESRRLQHDDGGNTELLLLHGDGGIGGGSAVGRRCRRWSWLRDGGRGTIVVQRWRCWSYCAMVLSMHTRVDTHRVCGGFPGKMLNWPKLQLYTQRFYFVFELGGQVWNFD